MASGQRVGYIRVSSLGQNPARQLDGVEVDRLFTDTVSGKSMQRPALSALLGFVRDGDVVIVHSMDRLARNLDDLRRLVRELTGRGVRVEFVSERLTFSAEDSPMATLLLSVLGAFAEFERALIRERQAEGIALAKARGAYKGRKRSLIPAQVIPARSKPASPPENRRPVWPASLASAGKPSTSIYARQNRFSPQGQDEPMIDDVAPTARCIRGVYQLRAVIGGISPLIWRRLLVPAQITIAELHAIVQTVFGWGGEYLHRFCIQGTEYGIYQVGGPWFRDNARTVCLGELGLRVREKFSYEYNFFAGWQVDLRVEQIRPVEPGRRYPRCAGGRRAGPPEGWGGPWDFLERTQPHVVLQALLRAGEIMGQLLDADADEKVAAVLGEADRDELAELLPLLGLEQFDRRACNTALAASPAACATERSRT